MTSIDTRITPISPSYESCAECYAKLLIYPGELHPDEVSNILQLEPSIKNVPGSTVTNSRGVTRKIKEAGWFLSSENFVSSKDLREHIDWLVSKLQPSKLGLRELQNKKNMKITLKCVWFSEAGHSGPVLWPEQMRAISDLDLECSFDIYFDGF